MNNENYYTATVDAVIASTPTEEQLEDLSEVLADLGALGAAVSLGGQNGLGATFTVYTPDYSPDETVMAAQAAVTLFVTGADKLGIPIAMIDRIDIMAGPFFERWLDTPPDELAGVTELAKLFGVSKQRMSELRTREDFPAPVAELAAGPVWKVSNLRRFLDSWERRPGRPRRTRAASQK